MSAAVDHITFRDALDHAQDYLRANPSAYTERLARQSILSAMREIGHNHQWSYYAQEGRLNLVRPFSSGTIQYDHSGGSYERVVILTPDDSGATFPTWATFGHIEIGQVFYRVAEWRSSLELQLSIHSNPTRDIDAGTPFRLYRDCYVLPVDFERCDKMYAQTNISTINYIPPAEWGEARHYHNSSGSGTPSWFTVKGSTDYQGCLEACFRPYPDLDLAVDFIYQRRPRKIAIENYETGTVGTSAGTKVVTGDGTAFEDDMVGAILRISENQRDVPTSRMGDNLYAWERMVMQVNSSTELVVDQNIPASLSGVKYVISDVIDIEAGAMGTLFLRALEAQLAKVCRFEDRHAVHEDYLRQLIQAREADSRSQELRSVGGPLRGPRMLKDHQYGHGPDIP